MRRSPRDIMADLLKIAKGGSKKTRLVYQGNLNFKVITPYLKQLEEKGFLEYNEETRTYFTTEAGLQFVEAYNRLESFMVEEPVIAE